MKKAIALVKNIHFQSLMGNGVMAGFGMFTTAVLYRSLSLSDIGIYTFFLTILGLIDTLRSGFLTTAFIKFYSGTEQERGKEVAGSAWALALAITAVSVLLNIPSFFLAKYINNAGFGLFLKYFSIISISTLPFFMANLAVQGDKRFDRLLWIRLINQILFTGTLLVLIFTSKSTLNNVVLAYVGSNLITSLSCFVLGWTKLDTLFKAKKATFWDLFHFGKFSMATGVSSNLFKVTDVFFLQHFLGDAAVAIYNLASRLLQLVEMPLLSFAASGMPSLSTYYNNNQKPEMMLVMKKMVGALSILFCGLAMFCILFAEPIIMILGGENAVHSAAPNLLRILMSIAILYPADRFFALTVDVINLPKINFYKILIMLALNLIGDFMGIIIFKSIYGIAVANILPLIAAIAITYVPLNRYSKFSFMDVYRVGYRELVALIKKFYKNFFNPSAE
ncbi:oligosaccharide flippase family protein [Pedobacter sp. MW01-1-1]|uniref:oligosaccharide flippase family protein n=1 Tax=Pedobacter sp. MW01-1-1 TaxID=3383027 RepID=UPI003FEEA563